MLNIEYLKRFYLIPKVCTIIGTVDEWTCKISHYHQFFGFYWICLIWDVFFSPKCIIEKEKQKIYPNNAQSPTIGLILWQNYSFETGLERSSFYFISTQTVWQFFNHFFRKKLSFALSLSTIFDHFYECNGKFSLLVLLSKRKSVQCTNKCIFLHPK